MLVVLVDRSKRNSAPAVSSGTDVEVADGLPRKLPTRQTVTATCSETGYDLQLLTCRTHYVRVRLNPYVSPLTVTAQLASLLGRHVLLSLQKGSHGWKGRAPI